MAQTAVTKYNELQLGVGRSGRGGVGQASVGEPEHNTMTMTELPYAEPKPKLRWYQYGLRTALVFVSLVSVGMSWLAVRMQSARAQREAVVAVQAAGGTVRYQHELDASGNVIPVDGLVWDAPVDEWGNPVPGESSPGADAPAPAWLRRLFGDDLFRTAVWACVGSNEGLEQVRRLTSLERLTLDPNCRLTVRDTGTKLPDASHHDMRCFYPRDDSEITDAGLERLQGLTKLRKLELWRVWGVAVTDDGVKKLRDALPNCTIETRPPTPHTR